jgi:hypothetical protein
MPLSDSGKHVSALLDINVREEWWAIHSSNILDCYVHSVRWIIVMTRLNSPEFLNDLAVDELSGRRRYGDY